MNRTTVGRSIASTVGLLLAASVGLGIAPATASAGETATAPQGRSTVTGAQPTAANYAMWEKQRRTRSTNGTMGASAVTAESRYLAQTRQQQINGYYCGPASVSEALKIRGMTVSQQHLGNLMQTTTNGTDWYGRWIGVPNATGYPIADAMNYYTGAGYVPVGLAYTPTSTDVSTFRSRLVADIDGNYPLIGNAWQVQGGPHLVGHPNIFIAHYFTIRGYSSYGNVTHYMDSAGSIAGYAIPAYASMNTSTITAIMGNRGYVW